MLVLAGCFLRGVEDVAPYNEWGNSVLRHIVCSCHLFSNGRFNISLRFMAHLLRKYVIAPTVRNKIKSVGEASISSRKVVRAVLRLWAVQFFALAQRLSNMAEGKCKMLLTKGLFGDIIK